MFRGKKGDYIMSKVLKKRLAFIAAQRRAKREYITSKVAWYEKITGGDIFIIAIFTAGCYVLYLLWSR